MTLVYDVGMHNGDDSAFYLSKGHSVVAIEAIPELAQEAVERFKGMVESGRLTVLNLAIADSACERDFWVCEELTTWSSLNQRLAARDRKKHHSIRIK